MLRLTVNTEEYLQIGENIKIAFLGGTGSHLRIMIDAPKDIDIVRSTVLEKNAGPNEIIPKFISEENMKKARDRKKYHKAMMDRAAEEKKAKKDIYHN